MASFFTGPWPFWLAAALLSIIALPLFIWAGFLDRPRGRKRCPKCWYDLTAVNTLTCSECGYTARKPRKLYKTRRHKRWAALALLLMIASTTLALTPKVKRDGIASITPTTVLIAGLEWWPSGTTNFPWARGQQRLNGFYDELHLRAREDTLWDWQWNWLINKCIEGDEKRRAPMSDWHAHYSFFLHHAAQHAIIDTHSEDPRIQEVRYAFWEFATREHWPNDTPVWVSARIVPVFERDFPRRDSVVLRSPVGRTLTTYSDPLMHVYLDHAAYGEKLKCVGTPRQDVHVLEFEMAVEFVEEAMILYPSEEVSKPFHRTFQLQTQISGTVENMLTAVEDDTVLETLAKVSSAKLYGNRLELPAQSIIDAQSQLSDATLALRFEIVRNDKIIASHVAWWSSCRTRSPQGHIWMPWEKNINFSIPNLDRQISRDSDHWQLRITGDPEVALRNFDCDRYWAGSVTIPLTVE